MCQLANPMPIADGLTWPESPRWRNGALWFSDVHNFRLMKVVPGQLAQVIAKVPGRPAGFGFFPDGRLLLATALDKRLCWVSADGRLSLAADLSGETSGLLNDMIVDASGRAWVGDTGFDLAAGGTQKPGTLFMWSPAAGLRRAAEEVRFPNGLAISADGRTLYLAETFGEIVTAFDVHTDGTLSNRRVHVQLEDKPDGLCLDDEGALWIALLWKQQFQRVAASGEITVRVSLSSERAISCVLGGEDRRSLFCGIAEIDESDKINIKRRGRIQSIPVPVAGAGIP